MHNAWKRLSHDACSIHVIQKKELLSSLKTTEKWLSNCETETVNFKVWLTIVWHQHHSCSRTWGRCSSCRCHRHISGCQAPIHPSRSVSRSLCQPTKCRVSRLGIEHKHPEKKPIGYFRNGEHVNVTLTEKCTKQMKTSFSKGDKVVLLELQMIDCSKF